MVIKFPTNLSQFELYSLADRVIKEYEIDSVNLNEFPIYVFNRIHYILGLNVDENFNQNINRVFTQKGSGKAVEEYLKLLGIDSTVTSDSEFNLVINIDIVELTNTDIIKYLFDAISFLIFYDELKIKVETLIQSVEFISRYQLTAIGIDVKFDLI